ncbi:hypothetical protein IAU60_001193 [Kwoniella sp. DSM 27419]
MAPKRRVTGSEDSSSSTQPSKRQVSHASRACDECRKRKIRCDGENPTCGVCTSRNLLCHYNDEDKRKTNVEHMEQLNARMDQFERLLKDLLHASSSQPASASHQVTVSPPPLLTGSRSQPSAMETQPGPSRRRAESLVMSESNCSFTMPDALPARSDSHLAPPPDTSPVSSTRLRSLEGRDDHDRFQRMEEGSGSLIQYGPTSLWSAASPRHRQVQAPSPRNRQTGDWVDWSRNLPSSLDISRAIHDVALEYFAAYYAPLVPGGRHGGLLGGPGHLQPHHGKGARSGRDALPDGPLLAPVALLSCLRFALTTTVHRWWSARPTSAIDRMHQDTSTLAWLWRGHALGLNIDCQVYVARGQLTEDERQERISAFWTVYVQDVFRALANGRQPMLPPASNVPLPRVDATVDEQPWKAPSPAGLSGHSPRPGINVNGLRSMHLTSFHWTVKLAVICHSILEKLYGPSSKGARDIDAAADLLRELESWYSQLPLHPVEATPLPHVLHLHLQYHLCVIFVLRPFYRSGVPAWADKCDRAALSILPALQLLDRIHGIKHCHHSFINIVFGAATIFLLRSSDPADPNRSLADIQRFNECVEIMSRLSGTWSEAAMSEYILRALQSEYVPAPSASANHSAAQAVPPAAAVTNDLFGDQQDIWGMFFSDQVYSWTDMMNSGRIGDDMGM